MIPFNDLLRMPDDEKARLACAMLRVQTSGRFILGPEVEAFEREWAAYCGAPVPAVGVASGTDAIKIALRACGVGAGDKVLTVANSCQATVTAIREIGAWPIYCDVGPDGLMDLNTAPTLKVAAILPVHLYGRVCNMKPIFSGAQQNHAAVVEDCCQAHGARKGGPPPGFTFAWAQAWSHYPTKNLGCLGDGGAITTNHPDTLRFCRELRNYGLGIGERWKLAAWGYNSRLDEMQAAILRSRLPLLDEANTRRAKMVTRYVYGLSPIRLPFIYGGNNHIIAIRHHERDEIARRLLDKYAIQTTIHYPIPTHLQLLRECEDPISLPETESWCDEVLSLPMGPYIREEEIDEVCAALKKIVESLP